MEYLFSIIEHLPDDIYLVSHVPGPEIMEPEILPEVLPAEPTVIPRPKEDDPFNVPAPLVDPTPKGMKFSFEIKRKKFFVVSFFNLR